MSAAEHERRLDEDERYPWPRDVPLRLDLPGAEDEPAQQTAARWGWPEGWCE